MITVGNLREAYVVDERSGSGTGETIYIDHKGREWVSTLYGNSGNIMADTTTCGAAVGYLKDGVIRY